ncbi:hypothetical protein GEMRC1_002303 [Eukaryota sp. GEM-RC1]
MSKNPPRYVTSQMPGFQIEDKIQCMLYPKRIRQPPPMPEKVILCEEATTDAVRVKCQQYRPFPREEHEYVVPTGITTEEVVELWEPTYKEFELVEDRERVLTIRETPKIVEEYELNWKKNMRRLLEYHNLVMLSYNLIDSKLCLYRRMK